MCWFVPRLARAMWRSDVTHVFAAAYWAFVLVAGTATGLGRILRRPVIVNYHSGEADDHLRRHPKTTRWIIERARELVVPSQYLHRVFRKYGYSSIVIPNAVDVETFRCPRRESPFLRLLCTRNLEPCYDVGTAVRAFRIVADVEPRAVLTIVGSGSQTGQLHRLVHDLDLADRVRFAGAVPHQAIASFYGESDIYLNASLVDNQPLSVLEAMASGLVVISTAVGGVEDLIRDEVAGYLVAPRSPDAIASAAIRVMHNDGLFGRMTEAAGRTLQGHDPRAVVDQWLRCYRLTLSSSESAGTAEIRDPAA
jgi:phenylacetate-CoA ligase